jgi:hypothetical protein
MLVRTSCWHIARRRRTVQCIQLPRAQEASLASPLRRRGREAPVYTACTQPRGEVCRHTVNADALCDRIARRALDVFHHSVALELRDPFGGGRALPERNSRITPLDQPTEPWTLSREISARQISSKALSCSVDRLLGTHQILADQYSRLCTVGCAPLSTLSTHQSYHRYLTHVQCESHGRTSKPAQRILYS